MPDLAREADARKLLWVYPQKSFALYAVMAFWLIGCQRTQDENLRRFVGDGTLPEAAVGPNETVVVDYRSNSAPVKRLELTVTPDGTLSVRRYAVLGDGPLYGDTWKFITEASERVALSAVEANNFRRRISVYRPPQLTRDGPGVGPKDCGTVLDADSRADIIFRDEQGDYGSFQLFDACHNDSATKLTTELRQLLSELPKTRTAAPPVW